MVGTKNTNTRFDWVDGLKAFAIIGILLNHFIEEFGAGPWFSNPSYNWPSFTMRLSHILPEGSNFLVVAIRFLGWLGDMGPGVFILLSGFTLTLSQLRNERKTLEFYRSRIIRLFPLYIAIHLIVLVFAILVHHPAHLNVFSPKIMLSLLGLRFTDSLFFFLNPSWWFIWLIIQFYIFFPLLYKILKKRGILFFFILTFIITIFSRLAGILHLTYSANLYYWMTGLFAGTRLVEFTTGMILAVIMVSEKRYKIFNEIKTIQIFGFSLLIYTVGFVCSWTYTGSLFSNMFITTGLSGIFFGFFKFIKSKHNFNSTLLFIGRNSFSVFLIHQPFMNFMSDHFHEISKIFLLLMVLFLSFPVGYILERLVNKLIEQFASNYQRLEPILTGRLMKLFIYLTTFIIILSQSASLVIQHKIGPFLNLLAVFYLFIMLFYLLADFYRYKKVRNPIIILFFIICGAFYSVLPPQWIPLVSVALLLVIPVYFILQLLFNSYLTLIFSLVVLVGFFSLTENYLRKTKPLETSIWSEIPALQPDNRTIYSLIPCKITHLRYNNYDYVLRTNNMGFNSPEINLESKDSNQLRIFVVGDAFTMPEGVDYSVSYPSLLGKILTGSLKNKKVQVINGGVTGYGPNEMLAEIKNYIDTIKPEIIINEFFINEFQEINLTPKQRLQNIGLIGHDSKRLKFWGYCQLILRYERFLRVLTNRPDYQYNYSKSLLNLYDKTSAYYSDTVIQKIDNYLGELKNICDKNKTKLLLMFVPGQIEVSSAEHISFYPVNINLNDTNKYNFDLSHKILTTLCKKHNIFLFDAKNALKDYPNQPVYFENSWHWNEKGHKLIADTLALKILTQISNEQE